MMALIDGDIVAMRCAFSAEGETKSTFAKARANTMIEEILNDVGADEFKIYLSGKDNFRYKIYPEYKANRLDQTRPQWEKETKEYLEREWGAITVNGCEADDYLGWHGMEGRPWTIICTIDKDLDQIPGRHYNFVTKEHYVISESGGLRNFYYQCLVGDTADGVKGVPNIGPKKANRILGCCESSRELFAAVREAYGYDPAFKMNAQVLWIWHKENDIWQWPEGVEYISELDTSP